MSRHRRRRRAPWSVLLLTGLVALAVLAIGGGATQSGWASARVVNSTDGRLIGSMAITHRINGAACSTTARMATVACRQSLGTTASPPATAPNDSITNNGDVTVGESVKVQSCGVVQLANGAASADPMLPHGAVSFDPSGGPAGVTGSGAVTLDSGGYATGVVSRRLGGSPLSLLDIGTTEYDYGYGIWFKTTAASGLLLGLASAPSDTPTSGTVTYDRSLTLSDGQVVFTADGAPTAASHAAYNDGNWHFAYASLRTVRSQITAVLGFTTTSVTLHVDGTSVSSPSTLSSLATTRGYWSIGGQGFTGSLSNALVYSGTDAPTTVPTSPYGSADERWQLDDNGYTTTTATLPASYGTPCAQVTLTLAFTGASPTSVTGTLATLASSAAASTGPLPSGGTQSLVDSTAKVAASYKTEIAGLHLYVPITFTYTFAGASTWTQTMTWSGDPTDVFWA